MTKASAKKMLGKTDSSILRAASGINPWVSNQGKGDEFYG